MWLNLLSSLPAAFLSGVSGLRNRRLPERKHPFDDGIGKLLVIDMIRKLADRHPCGHTLFEMFGKYRHLTKEQIEHIRLSVEDQVKQLRMYAQAGKEMTEGVSP